VIDFSDGASLIAIVAIEVFIGPMIAIWKIAQLMEARNPLRETK
jgi:hypothetical protein